MASTKYAEGTLSKHKGHKEIHVKKLHNGYNVTRTDEDGNTTEHAAENLEDVHDHLQDHMEPADEQQPEDEADQDAEQPQSVEPDQPEQEQQ